VAGRYLLNPLFQLLAPVGAREIMTAAALLIVLGSALLMETVGLSMALGAFLAGLLLAESNFKHQLEADIEPFRGLLRGLFFMSVGMGLDLPLLAQYALPLLAMTALLLAGKIVLAAILLRRTCSDWQDAWRAAALLSPAGEFSFVLVPMAAGLAMLQPVQAALVTAAAALTMLLGPLVAKAIETVIARREAARALVMSDLPEENFDGASGSVLVIGFGRFGQIVNQVMLTEGVDVTVIDTDVEVIKVAPRFGVKVYFGDGSRLDVLHAAGAARARLIAICVDKPDVALRITELTREQFPLARIYVRAFDRRHAIELAKAGADFHMRETMLSAMGFGGAVLRELGVSAERAREVVDDVRRRDEQRLLIQQSEGLMGGVHLLKPEPLAQPKTQTRALNEETRAVIESQPQ
ncbi:MAG: cation:proton antiporter, partial [Beijerinckiaceae bacterium]